MILSAIDPGPRDADLAAALVLRLRRSGEHWFPEDPLHPPRVVCGVQTSLRRAAFAVFVGDLDGGEEVREGCGEPGCCNPAHLEIRPARTPTPALRLRDMSAKFSSRRAAPGDPKPRLRRTLSKFQKMLLASISGRRSPEGHWFRAGSAPQVVRHPLVGGTITLKRALYAAFEADIPENVELRAGCGVSGCVRPGHQSLEPSRSVPGARALSLPERGLVGSYSKMAEYESRAQAPESGAPEVERMALAGASLSEISAATGLSIADVVRLRNAPKVG